MLPSSTCVVASRSLAVPGGGQPRRAQRRAPASTASSMLRCRQFDGAPPPRLVRATRRSLAVASSSPSSPDSNARDDAVLKSIVEAAAAAAKAARASASEASSSSSSFASVSSSDDTSSGLRGATVSPRRTRLITFTCNKCDARTERSINPTAWDKGLVFVQCGTCQARHKVADAAGLIDEVVFPSERTASLVRSDSLSSSSAVSPELAFESADEPHGLVPLERDDGGEE